MDRRALSVLVDRAVDAPEDSNANHLRRRAIFIIDTDADARRNIETRLATLRLTNPTVGLADGEDALQTLRYAAELGLAWVPALVLLDVELPGRSGLDIVRAMRETVGLEKVPVVVLSAVDDAACVTEAYHLGVRSYLVKPAGFDALASILSDLDLPWSLT
jgi:DNA-binding response OmpR family regulator